MFGKSSATHEVLDRWSRLAVPFEVSRSDARRQRFVEAIGGGIQRAIVRRQRIRRLVRMAWAAALVLGAGAAIAVAYLVPQGAPRPIAATIHVLSGTYRATMEGRGLDTARPSEQGSLPPGAEVLTGSASQVHARLMSGVEITTGSETDLTLPRELQFDRSLELGLKTGFISVDVPKLIHGETFLVRTPDTLITVHGTSFSVEVTKTATAPVTRVRVTEGLVTTRVGESEQLLRAGMEWESVTVPSDVGVSVASPAPAGRVDPTTASQENRPLTRRIHPAPRASGWSAPDTSMLAEQNRLFQSAMDAEGRGDHAGALVILDDVMSRYPASALAQDAQVQRFRILARTGARVAAGRAAARYLSAYPHGFAIAEARALVMEMR